jgi:Diacylglycerol kinase catalytic domain
LNEETAGPATAPAAGGGASAPPCLIVNPQSFRASRGLAARAAAVATAGGAEVVRLDRAASLNAAVDSILARRQRQVAVLAGDGTVREIVDRLAALPPGHWRPDLLILPGGRTNLTAADLVPRGKPLVTLKRALSLAREGRWDSAIVERVPLRIEQAPAPPRYGFFVGGAWVDSVVRRAQDYRYGGSGPLRAGHLSTPWVLLRLGVLALIGRSGLSSPRLQVVAGVLGSIDEPVRLLLATTLLHRTGLFDPYAARGEGELRVTAVTRRAPRFWRALPRLLAGRYSKSMNTGSGYLSGRCERVLVTGLAGYSLDGERFDTDPARPVLISPGPRLRFFSS